MKLKLTKIILLFLALLSLNASFHLVYGEENSTNYLATLAPLTHDLPLKENPQDFQGQPNRLVLRSVGDVLIHDRVSCMADTESWLYREAKEALINLGYSESIFNPEDVYDFMPMLAYIQPYTDYADVTVANLEVIAASPQLPMSGYPNFNAPKQLLRSLKDIGVDIVANATNHTLDWSSQGVYYSLENLDEAGLMYYGSYDSWEDYRTPRIIEANNIKLGFLSYSYGTNGIPVPNGEEYLINLIDLDIMLREIEILSQEVDAIVVSLQLGGEYDPYPNQEQFYVFQSLADAGVKLILGGHPHVPQPFDWYNDGASLAIYSQASFLTGQRDFSNKIGGILEVTFVKEDQGNVTVIEPKYMPIFNLGIEAEKMYQVVPMADIDYHQIPEGQYWWQYMNDHMTYYTDSVDVISHLETKWTEEAEEILR